jgi:CheY-like chemotaxis protein
MMPGSITILCVDDEPIPRELRKLILSKQGYRVVTAASGFEALDLLHAGGIDFILSDQMMPGMSGTDLAKRVRGTWPNLPFLLVSGVNEIPAGAEYADGFVSKVAGPEVLFENIKDVLAQYGHAGVGPSAHESEDRVMCKP